MKTYSTLPQIPSPAAPPELEPMLTVKQVCALLHLKCPRVVYRAIREGTLVSSMIGKSHLVSESNLARFLKGQEQ